MKFLYFFIFCLSLNFWHVAFCSHHNVKPSTSNQETATEFKSTQSQPQKLYICQPLTTAVPKRGDKRLSQMLTALTGIGNTMQQQYESSEYKNGTEQIKEQTNSIKKAVKLTSKEFEDMSELESFLTNHQNRKKKTTKTELQTFMEKVNQLNLLHTQSAALVKTFTKPTKIDAETQTDPDEDIQYSTPPSPILTAVSDTTSESSTKSVESLNNSSSDTESDCRSVTSTCSTKSAPKSMPSSACMPQASSGLCTLFEGTVLSNAWEVVDAFVRGTEFPQKSRDFALFRAAGSDNFDSVNLLLDKGAEPNAFQDNYTPLHVASANGNAPIVKKLIACKADVNTPVLEKGDSFLGLTPVQIAAKNDHREIVDLLVSSKADIITKDPTGNSVLDYLRAAQRTKQSASIKHKKKQPTGLTHFLTAGSTLYKNQSRICPSPRAK
jgi:hypothetical protein